MAIFDFIRKISFESLFRMLRNLFAAKKLNTKSGETPGVFIEENSTLLSSISQAETSTAVFIGYTATATFNGNSLTGIPTLINSESDYQTKYNSGNPALTQIPDGCYLPDSIKLFYDNGGGKCYVISVGDFTPAVSFNALQSGLEASKNVSAQLIVIPDAVSLSANELGMLQDIMLQMCNDLQNRFSILDTLKPTANFDNDLNTFRNNLGLKNLTHGAAYYPWLKLNEDREIPSAGAIAAIYAMIDSTQGVWKAPASVNVNSVSSLSVNIDDQMQTLMNSDAGSGKFVNAIRTFVGRGILVWGARTLAGNDNEWRYISVRRLFSMVEESVKKSLEPVIFEPNEAGTWLKVRTAVANYLTQLWKQGAFAGSTAKDAFFVKCGLDDNMTNVDLDEGRMIVEIGIAPARPAEFVILRILFSMQKS
jgi:phage tail sheath protein FI